MVQRARQGFIATRTATINCIRGLLSELGIVLPLKVEVVHREATSRLEDLPGYANTSSSPRGRSIRGSAGRMSFWEFDAHVGHNAFVWTHAESMVDPASVSAEPRRKQARKCS